MPPHRSGKVQSHLPSLPLETEIFGQVDTAPLLDTVHVYDAGLEPLSHLAHRPKRALYNDTLRNDYRVGQTNESHWHKQASGGILRVSR